LGAEDPRNLNPTWQRKWREAANFGGSSADYVILHAGGSSCNHSTPFAGLVLPLHFLSYQRLS
jgi:hypothetical protein